MSKYSKYILLIIISISHLRAFSQKEFGAKFRVGFIYTKTNLVLRESKPSSTYSFKEYERKGTYGFSLYYNMYKGLRINIGIESIPIFMTIGDTYPLDQKTKDRFNTGDSKSYTEHGYSYMSFPIGISYNLPLYKKNIYIEPYFGFAYLYHKETNYGNSQSYYYQGIGGTTIQLFGLYNDKLFHLNTHSYNLQYGVTLNIRIWKFYFGVDFKYNQGLNYLEKFTVDSYNKDIYSNSMERRNNYTFYTKGSFYTFGLNLSYNIFPLKNQHKKLLVKND